MLKRTITYENFNGVTVTEEHNFNLSQSELMELEAEYDGGLGDALTKIVNANDTKGLIREMKRIILMSYGIKSADGSTFEKSDELRKKFAQSPAYDSLFMELATSENAAVDFIQGIVPKALRTAILEQQFLQQNKTIIEATVAQVNGDPMAPPPLPTLPDQGKFTVDL
jgi:hypothetical protein